MIFTILLGLLVYGDEGETEAGCISAAVGWTSGTSLAIGEA